jgi:hypothetical protein
VQQVVDEAHENAVALSAVTPDGIAGTLFAAAGVATTSIPVASPPPPRIGPLAIS